MHIPDNYLSPSTCLVLGAAVAPVLAVAAKKVKEDVSESGIPMLGIGAAFSFLIMMFNIPLPGGTTGHAVGGVLLAILMGPHAACISITVALLIQALIFGDGGILALPANCFNMAFVMPYAGYFIYRIIKGKTGTAGRETLAIALAAYLGINLAAFFAAFEFGIQPLLFTSDAGQPLYCPYPLSVSIPAMLLPHLLVAGFVEAAFSVAIYKFIKRVSPQAIYNSEKRIKPIYSLLAGLAFLSPLGILAAGTAWGEWGSEQIADVVSKGSRLGYVPEGMSRGFQFDAPFSDYAFAGLPDAAGYLLSAIGGAAILVIVFKIINSMIQKRIGNGIG